MENYFFDRCPLAWVAPLTGVPADAFLNRHNLLKGCVAQ